MQYSLFPRTILTTCLLTFAGFAQTAYQYDDGVANSGLGFSGVAVDYVWLQWFEVPPNLHGVDTITSLELAVGSYIPLGTEIHLCVWEDPNDDGLPEDGILVGQAVGTVQSSGTNEFVSYVLPNPALVHGKFFVGAYLTTEGNGESPAALDYDNNLHGVAFFTWDYQVGGFDPNALYNYAIYHIEVLGGGIHGVFLLRATGSGETPVIYCIAKTNSLGCVPSIGFSGTPSASAGSGFVISAANVLNQVTGLLFYSAHGRAALPFYGGTLCVQGPYHRTVLQGSGGTSSGHNCTGQYAFDFNAWIAGGHDAGLLPGTTINAQYFYRDQGFLPPNNIGLSDALEFTIAP